ncbi:MAG: PASTA domain-containing protein, partial [Actinomycetota bacterium]
MPQYATAVWVGNPKGRTPIDGYGGTVAAPIWHDYMLSVLRGLPVEDFAKSQHRIKPPSEKLPDVVGMQEDAAIASLEEAGFSATVREVDDEG